MLFLYPDGDLDAEPERWVRRGACNRCGKCCEDAHMIGYYRSGWKEGDPIDLDTGRDNAPGTFPLGSPVVAEDWNGHRVWWQKKAIEKKEPCGSYDGGGACAWFETEEWKEQWNKENEICRKWPIMPQDLDGFPECGFWFERSKDGS